MSVPDQDPQATFFDAGFLAQALFDAGDPYEIFRREVYPALQAMRDPLKKTRQLGNSWGQSLISD